MNEVHVVWVALPAHTDDTGRLLVRAYARLQLVPADAAAGGTLADFPAAVRDWAATVTDTRFDVRVRDSHGDVVVEEVALAPGGEVPPDPRVWRATFPPPTPDVPVVPVGAWEPTTHAEDAILTAPADDLLSLLTTVYGETATSHGTNPPSIDDPMASVARLRRFRGLVDQVRGTESYVRETGSLADGSDFMAGVVDDGDDDTTSWERALLALLRFYTRPDSPSTESGDHEPPPYGPEFHERLSLLGDHPRMLAALGIVVTLRLEATPADLAAVELDGPEPPTITVVPRWPDGWVPTSTLSPRTTWEVSEADNDQPDHFFARPWVDDDLQWLDRGWLVLEGEDGPFGLHDVDLDGGALKLAHVASHVGNLTRADLRGPTTELTAPLPTLRSGGWTLTWAERGAAVVSRFEATASLATELAGARTLAALAATSGDIPDPDVPLTLWAEQVVRGLRLDVEEAGGPPRSVHHRRVRHEFTTDPSLVVEYVDEGFAKGLVATSTPAESPPDGDPVHLYVHEAVVGWDGWSLAAARPGRHLPDGADDEAPPVDYHDVDHAELGIATTIRVVDGSLPRLRFGRAYRFGVRVVDLAGTSHAPGSSAHFVAHATPTPLRHARYEPVEPPTVMRTRPDTEGESLRHLVIRSGPVGDVDPAPPEEYGTALGGLSGVDAYPATSNRLLVPPRSSVEHAIRHGRFDEALADPGATGALHDLASREDRVVELDGDGVPIDLQPGPMQRPFLPDPLAHAILVVVRDHAGRVIDEDAIDWDAGFRDPRALPLRLRHATEVDPASETRWLHVAHDEADPFVEVTLRPGEQVHVELSSRFPDDALDLLGIWRWANPPDDELGEHAVAGRHWMLSPRVHLTATHAVQRPLLAPESRLRVHREPGSTEAVLVGQVGIEPDSTGRLELLADWAEPVDEGEMVVDVDRDPAGELTWPWVRRRAVAHVVDVPAPDHPGHHHDVVHRDWFEVTLHDPATTSDQGDVEWGRCIRCQMLVRHGATAAVCPAARTAATTEDPSPPDPVAGDQRDQHAVVGPERYVLPAAGSGASGGWRECGRCHGLVASLDTTDGCPVDGLAHQPLGPLVVLPVDGVGEPGWWQCRHCHTLWTDAAEPRPCAGAQVHEPDAAVGELPVPRFDRRAVHQFGDTRHRRVVYHASASTRFREFLPDEVTDVEEDLVRREVEELDPARHEPAAPWAHRESAVLTHRVPSTARPDAPVVERIVPTVKWEDHSTDERAVRQRLGGRLRVFLRRPWYSSGEGEQLAVVLAPHPLASDGPTEPITDPLLTYVTTFSSDPSWVSAAPTAHATVGHVPSGQGAPSGEGLVVPELPDARVTVATHDVHPDPRRNLWYADVELDLDETYFPLVRLALARFQPWSLPGVELSPISQGGFVQTLPDRRTELRVDGRDHAVVVSGPVAHRRLPHPRRPHVVVDEGPRVVARIEERGSGLGDLGWEPVTADTTLSQEGTAHRAQWSGTVTMPRGRWRGPRRLLVEETERVPVDPDTWEQGITEGADVPPTMTRVVHAVVFDLSG